MTAMTQKQLTREQTKWEDEKFPYDYMNCGWCLSQHNAGDYPMCGTLSHAVVERAVTEAGLLNQPQDAAQVAIFRKLRKRFARFYPKRKT
jgi:hypothetical protein